MDKRSLYQCLNAKVKGDRIYCAKGHPIGRANDGTVPLVSLVRGASLQRTICQDCSDYDEMGPPIPKEERGWAYG